MKPVATTLLLAPLTALLLTTPLGAMADATIQYLLKLGVRQSCGAVPGEFASPYTVAYDPGGRLYALDTACYPGQYTDTGVESNRLQVFAPDRTFLYTVEPSDGIPFWHPTGLAFDADGKMLVADWNDRVVLFSAATASTPPMQLAAVGTSENHDPLDPTAEPGPAPVSPLVFWGAWSIAVKPGTHLQNASDAAGRVAVVDNGNHRVVVLNSMLQPIYAFGGHIAGETDDPAGSLEYPQGVAIDANGYFYVSDTDNSRVQVFREVEDVPGQPRAEYVRMFGSAIDPLGAFGSSPGDISRPRGINFDPQGRLWITDGDRSRLLRVSVGQDIDPAGLPACQDVVDYRVTSRCYVRTSDGENYETLLLGVLGGDGERALFTYPSGVAVSHLGEIAVADTDNQVVQIFRPAEAGLIFQGSATVPPGPHGVNQPIAFSVSLTNTGAYTLDVALTASALDGDESFAGTFAPLPGGTIAPGASQSFPITFTPGEPGTFALRVGASGAPSAGSNVLTGGTVDAGTLMVDGGEVLPGLGMSMAATPSGGIVNVGDVLTFTLRLRNTGLTPLTNVTAAVTLTQGGALAALVEAPAPASLAALAEADFTFRYQLNGAGALTLRPSATADYVDESSVTQQITATAADAHFTISSDSIAPTTTATVPPATPSGWHNDAIHIGLQAEDNPGGSGVSAIFWRIVEENGDFNLFASPEVVVLRQGIFHVAYYAVDHAGNQEPAHQLTLKIDSIAPTMGTPIVTSAIPAQNGWYRSEPTITFVAGDGSGGSGVATITSPITVTTEGANQTFTGSAFDHAQNRSTDAVVTVNVDRTPPQLSCSANGGGIAWPPNHKMVAWNPVVTVDDAMSGGATFTLISASSNEAANGKGDGNTTADLTEWTIGTPDTSGFVRAERSGKGAGRIYTLVYEAADRAGNTATCSVSLAVPHDKGK
jgi:sugar lactone lactonase YvrE